MPAGVYDFEVEQGASFKPILQWKNKDTGVPSLPFSNMRISAADATSNGNNVTVTAYVPTAPSAWAGLAVASYN